MAGGPMGNMSGMLPKQSPMVGGGGQPPGMGPLMGFKPQVPPQGLAQLFAGLGGGMTPDIKSQLAGFSMNMLGQQLGPRQGMPMQAPQHNMGMQMRQPRSSAQIFGELEAARRAKLAQLATTATRPAPGR